MAPFVVWMDHEQAKVFRLGEKDVVTQVEVHHHHAKNHNHPRGDGPPDVGHTNAYFHAVSEALRDASEIYLLGAGTGKTEFQHYLDKHFSANLAKRVAGTQKVDHLTDKEIIAMGKKFFHQLHKSGLASR